MISKPRDMPRRSKRGRTNPNIDTKSLGRFSTGVPDRAHDDCRGKRQSNVELKDHREAVLSLLLREEAAAVIARRIGVSEPTLYRWRDEFMAAGEAALASGSGRTDPC
jgi:hypothetical protein